MRFSTGSQGVPALVSGGLALPIACGLPRRSTFLQLIFLSVSLAIASTGLNPVKSRIFG